MRATQGKTKMPRLRGIEKLTGAQYKGLHEALLDAFSLQRFNEMVVFYLERDPEDLSVKPDRSSRFLDAILKADREGWSAELLQAARTADPINLKLLAFAQQFQLATSHPRVATTRELQRTIKQANGFIDPDEWRTRMAHRERQVCRIMYRYAGEDVSGTGFLLGPDVIMTNYHVMELVIKKKVKPDRVELRFDYKMLGQQILNQGIVYRLLAEDWCIDASEYSPIDLEQEPGNNVPRPDQLDYALLRVAGTPGSDPIGGPDTPDPQAPIRGFIEPPIDEHDFKKNPAIFILQHPDGHPLKLALDSESVICSAEQNCLNSNGTRVRHTTTTEGGSSGAPCFDVRWSLIALHHMGDPNYAQFHKPQYNQAIPWSAIRALLTHRNKLDELGGAS